MRRSLLFALAGVYCFAVTGTAHAQNLQINFRLLPGVEVAKSPEFLAVGDMNDDGLPDLVASSPTSAKITVLIGSIGEESFSGAISAGPFVKPYSRLRQAAVGDVNGDFINDIVVADSQSDNVIVLVGNGNGTVGSPSFLKAGDEPWGVAVAPFGTTGCNDIAVANQKSNTISILFNRCLDNGRVSFGPPTNYPAGVKPGLTFSTDVNDDGLAEVFTINTGNQGGQDSTELLNIGNGAFQNQGNWVVGDGAQQATTGDFNSDGIADLLIANGRRTSKVTFSSNFTILLGDGFGFFNRSPNVNPINCQDLIPETRTCQPTGIATADFNFDGILDIAVGVQADQPKVIIYAGNGDATFDLATLPIDIIGNPTQLAVADFDDDGRMDIAIAERADATSQGIIRLLRNITEFPPTPATLTPTPTATQQVSPGAVSPTPIITPGKKINGDTCNDGSECNSTFCEQGRCCNRACNGVTERCDLGTQFGMCIAITPPRTVPPSPTNGGGGTTIVGRSGGCSAGDTAGSPAAQLAMLFVPIGVWLGRRRILVRAPAMARRRPRIR